MDVKKQADAREATAWSTSIKKRVIVTQASVWNISVKRRRASEGWKIGQENEEKRLTIHVKARGGENTDMCATSSTVLSSYVWTQGKTLHDPQSKLTLLEDKHVGAAVGTCLVLL